jgi:aminomethyltransferase
LKRTPLYDYHAANSKLADFAGYQMPLWYTSTTEEHLAVRNNAGIFDVSHMGRVIIDGPDSTKLTESLVPTGVSSQVPGKSFYTLLLNTNGGIIDDLIIMKQEQGYLWVINAANKDKDLAHIRDVAKSHDVGIRDVTDSTTMIAIQGPEAGRALQPLTPTDLSSIKRYTHTDSKVGTSKAMITRTGYTGEDGFEIILFETGLDNNTEALRVWDDLARRARPSGLGARDSLRIEAGLPLYGSDIDETTNPIEAELSWVIAKGKSGYVGSESIASFSAKQPTRTRRGMMLTEKIPRHGFTITDVSGSKVGEVTSGTFSPILRKGIAIGYVDSANSKIGETVNIAVRESAAQATITKTPFYDEKRYGWKRNKQ